MLLQSGREASSCHHDQGIKQDLSFFFFFRINEDIFFLRTCIVVWRVVPPVSCRPAIHSSVPLQRGVGPGRGRSCGEHGSSACAGCCAAQHHRAKVRTFSGGAFVFKSLFNPPVLFQWWHGVPTQLAHSRHSRSCEEHQPWLFYFLFPPTGFYSQAKR